MDKFPPKLKENDAFQGNIQDTSGASQDALEPPWDPPQPSWDLPQRPFGYFPWKCVAPAQSPAPCTHGRTRTHFTTCPWRRLRTPRPPHVHTVQRVRILPLVPGGPPHICIYIYVYIYIYIHIDVDIWHVLIGYLAQKGSPRVS